MEIRFEEGNHWDIETQRHTLDLGGEMGTQGIVLFSSHHHSEPPLFHSGCGWGSQEVRPVEQQCSEEKVGKLENDNTKISYKSL